MIIDIRDDLPDLAEYVRKRVEQQVTSTAKSGGRVPPVSGLTFGFEFGQANWVALVFDSRPVFEPDGEWTREIDKRPRLPLNRPCWPIWGDLPEGEVVHFIDLRGEKINVMDDPDELICGIVGEALRRVLLTAREKGVFAPLTRTARCEMAVENIEGFYGWPEHEDRGKENLV